MERPDQDSNLDAREGRDFCFHWFQSRAIPLCDRGSILEI